MNEEAAFRKAREFVVSNVQPPQIIAISSRERLGDQMVVFSHLEIWRWRVVLRGAIADVEAPSPRSCDADDGSSGRSHESSEHRWLGRWHAIDDLGTEYRQTSAGCGGSGTDFWMDLEVQIEPAPPTGANRLSLTGPNDAKLDIDLSTSG